MTTETAPGGHAGEPHRLGLAQRLNWLRAGVLGANDGIVSTAAVVVGVASATSDVLPVLRAGSAALVGGAISMALGEYVSVSSQRDTERALIEKERRGDYLGDTVQIIPHITDEIKCRIEQAATEEKSLFMAGQHEAAAQPGE